MSVERIAMDMLLAEQHRAIARSVAREEIASLCGLVLRRLQDVEDEIPVRALRQVKSVLAQVMGEALRDFGGTPAEPGEVTPR